MSIEQKIAEILAESKVTKVDEDKETEVVAEATDINDPSDGSEENPDVKKNNVDKQDLEEPKAAIKEEADEPTLDIKEDVAALVAGEELSEEFKQKAATIFEAAVMNRVKQEVAKLDEAYEVKLAEQVEEIKEGLVAVSYTHLTLPTKRIV